jgi:hypothetical protein
MQSFTCEWSSLTKGFVIENGAGNDFWLSSPSLSSVASAGLTNQLVRTYLTLGFLGNYNNTPATASTELYGGIPTFVATRFVDICSSYLTKYQRVKDTSTLINQPRSDMLCRIYPVAPNTRVTTYTGSSVGSEPFSICIDYNTPKQASWSVSEAINNFDIQVRDEFGELLPFTPQYGCEYQMSFLATET